MLDEGDVSCLIVGCGNIAGRFDSIRPLNQFPLTHAGAYTMHGGFSIRACVDPNVSQRQEFMQHWRILDGASSIAGLQAPVGHFDVVSICSPTSCHRADVTMALSLKPKLIFCEKPLASSLNEAMEIVAACKLANVPLLVNYSRRWDKAVAQLRNDLERGIWGAVRSVSGNYTRGIANNGSHMVDLLNFLFGRLHISNVGPMNFDGVDNDPTIPFVLELNDFNSWATINCGNGFDFSLFELEVVTERGVIAMEDGGMWWRIRKVVDSPQFHGYKVLDDGQNRFSGSLQGAMSSAVSEIFDIVVHERTTLTSEGDNALAALSICEKIRSLSTSYFG